MYFNNYICSTVTANQKAFSYIHNKVRKLYKFFIGRFHLAEGSQILKEINVHFPISIIKWNNCLAAYLIKNFTFKHGIQIFREPRMSH